MLKVRAPNCSMLGCQAPNRCMLESQHRFSWYCRESDCLETAVPSLYGTKHKASVKICHSSCCRLVAHLFVCCCACAGYRSCVWDFVALGGRIHLVMSVLISPSLSDLARISLLETFTIGIVDVSSQDSVRFIRCVGIRFARGECIRSVRCDSIRFVSCESI